MNKEKVETQKASDLFHENKAVRDLSAELGRYEGILLGMGVTPEWGLFVSQHNILVTLGHGNMLTDDKYMKMAMHSCNAIIERFLREKQMKDLAACCADYLSQYLLPKMGLA